MFCLVIELPYLFLLQNCYLTINRIPISIRTQYTNWGLILGNSFCLNADVLYSVRKAYLNLKLAHPHPPVFEAGHQEVSVRCFDVVALHLCYNLIKGLLFSLTKLSAHEKYYLCSLSLLLLYYIIVFLHIFVSAFLRLEIIYISTNYERMTIYMYVHTYICVIKSIIKSFCVQCRL